MFHKICLPFFAFIKKRGGGEVFDPEVQKVRMSTPEISKALMESIKHRKYGQKSDYYPSPPPTASITMRLEGIQESFKIKTK